MRGVIYARYSSDNQREESIEGQIRECKAFADRNGIDASNICPTLLSSSKTSTEVWDKLLVFLPTKYS